MKEVYEGRSAFHLPHRAGTKGRNHDSFLLVPSSKLTNTSFLRCCFRYRQKITYKRMDKANSELRNGTSSQHETSCMHEKKYISIQSRPQRPCRDIFLRTVAVQMQEIRWKQPRKHWKDYA